MKDYEELSRLHFNKQACDYDKKNTVYYSREGKISCAEICKFLKSNDYSRLLDVGCGTAYLAELLSKTHNGSYTGLDISENMIEVARLKGIPNAEFVLGKSDALPFEENSFDIVTCSQSFHHYPRQDEAMKEAYRVLKKGGIYILSDTGIGGLGAWLDNHLFFKLLRSGDCKTQNRHGISRMMKRIGFECILSKQISRMIYMVVGRK